MDAMTLVPSGVISRFVIVATGRLESVICVHESIPSVDRTRPRLVPSDEAPATIAFEPSSLKANVLTDLSWVIVASSHGSVVCDCANGARIQKTHQAFASFMSEMECPAY